MTRSRNRAGLTIVEVLVALAILGTASVGAMSYQFYSNRQMRNAQVSITATQIAQLFMEDWKSIGGDENYNPTTLGLGFTVPTDGDGDYELIVDGVTLRVTHAWQDVLTDAASGMTIRQITVRIKWRYDLKSGTLGTQVKQLEYVTYVRRDAGGD